MKYILISFLLISFNLMSFADSGKLNLTMLLKELQKFSGVSISYSPTITDKIYPVKPDWFPSPDIEATLTHLLLDTDIEFQKIGPAYSLYPAVKVEEEAVEKLTVVTERKDIRLDSLQPAYTMLYPEVLRVVSDLHRLTTGGYHPQRYQTPDHPRWSIRTNIPLLLTGSVNAGISYAFRSQWSAGLDISYNPWSYGEARIRHLTIRPQVRAWLCDYSGGHFLSAGLRYTRFNVGVFPSGWSLFPQSLRDNRFQGNSAGVALGYGYSWILGKRLSLELEVGVGVSYNSYTKYPCSSCGTDILRSSKLLLAPDKLALNLVYVLK